MHTQIMNETEPPPDWSEETRVTDMRPILAAAKRSELLELAAEFEARRMPMLGAQLRKQAMGVGRG
jgi:hypothetical protein